jgi:hypothetical protein
LYTRWHKTPLWARKRLKLLVIDECDEFCNPSGIEAVVGNSEYEGFQPELVMGCTATYKRPGTGLEVIMDTVLGTNIVTRKFDVKFTVNKICTGIVGNRQDAKYTRGVDWHVLSKSLFECEARTRLTASLAIARVEEGRKVMIICTENNHAESIFNILEENGADTDWFYGSKKKTYRDSSILVAGAKKAGRGFDEAGACKSWNGKRIDCVIIAGFVNNETDLIQWIGRAFRAKDPIIDHLVDADKTIENQWLNMRDVYTWMKATINVVYISEEA